MLFRIQLIGPAIGVVLDSSDTLFLTVPARAYSTPELVSTQYILEFCSEIFYRLSDSWKEFFSYQDFLLYEQLNHLSLRL